MDQGLEFDLSRTDAANLHIELRVVCDEARRVDPLRFQRIEQRLEPMLFQSLSSLRPAVQIIVDRWSERVVKNHQKFPLPKGLQPGIESLRFCRGFNARPARQA